MNSATPDELEPKLAQLVQQTEQLTELVQELVLTVRAQVTPPKAQQPKEPLYLQVQALIAETPRRFSDLKRLTKAEDNAIKSVLIRLQRDDRHVVNLGNRHKALWAIVSDAFLVKAGKSSR